MFEIFGIEKLIDLRNSYDAQEENLIWAPRNVVSKQLH